MKQKQLYQTDGYLNYDAVIDDHYPFTFIIGGRGTGKTYGALLHCFKYFKETQKPIIYMRRTSKQAELLTTVVFNPYKPINNVFCTDIRPYKISKGIKGFYEFVNDEPVGNYLSVMAALTTFSNFRGFDGLDFDILIYDEFIKNVEERSIKDEAFALKNVYETINRNRELQGRPPLKLIALSNSNAIDNDIFVGFEIVSAAETMIKLGKNQYYDDDRGIAIYNLTDSPISQSKRQTALYKADAGSNYTEMALGNKYADYDTTFVRSQPLREYRPIVQYGELTVYRHKSDTKIYASFHHSGSCPIFGTSSIERERFIRRYGYLWEHYLNTRVYFESFITKKYFEKIFI